MKLYCTLVSETYKYSYGNYNPWEVPFKERESMKLTCARNDSAAAQLLLYSEEEMMVTVDKAPALYETYPVKTVRVETSFEGLTGHEVTMNLVGLVRDDDGNYKSEVILGEQRRFNEKLKVQPVWIEVKTSEETKPGEYTGKVKVYYSDLFGDEVLHKEISIQLEVMPALLKPLHEGDFYLDLWQHHTSIARTYEVALWSEEHFRLLEEHLKVLKELGQKAITVIVSEAPWSGQWSSYYRTNASDYFEYNMVSIKRTLDGEWQYDFTAMNRYINLCLSYGINKEIEIFGLLGIWTMADAGYGKVIEDSEDAIRVRYLDEATGTYKYIRHKADLEEYIRAIDQNIADNGWQGLAKIVCDEPGDINLFKNTLGALSKLTPHMKFKVTICSLQVVLEDFEGIDDYVINLPLILSEEERIKEIREQKDSTMSYYVAIDPKTPNTFLSCHLAESRVLPWLSYYMNMDGFLRWAIWLWPNDPFNYESYHYQKFRAGGTHFVYPGKNGKPLYSLRYKNLKKGIRDYMIFKAYVEKTGDKEAVYEAIKGIMKVDHLEQMKGAYRRENHEVLSLNYWDYEERVNHFLKAL